MAGSGTWLDLMERLTRLGELADRKLDPGVRHVALTQVARECDEASVIASVLADAGAGLSSSGGVQAELTCLGRDLEVLSGAGMLLELAPDREVADVMLRAVVRHGSAAARRARRVLDLGVDAAVGSRSPRGPDSVGGVAS